MNFEPLKTTEVIELWSTTVMKQQLPNSARVNTLLLQFLKGSLEDQWIERDDQAARWLRAQVKHGAERYFQQTGLDWGAAIRMSAWFEIHEFGDYRSLGNQPGAVLSGRYGVTLPTDLAQGPARDDLHPGYISFFDPRSAMNMNAINQDPYLKYHCSIELKPGLLLMWPSYLSFFIHPNLSRSPRVNVAFDIYKGDDGR